MERQSTENFSQALTNKFSIKLWGFKILQSFIQQNRHLTLGASLVDGFFDFAAEIIRQLGFVALVRHGQLELPHHRAQEFTQPMATTGGGPFAETLVMEGDGQSCEMPGQRLEVVRKRDRLELVQKSIHPFPQIARLFIDLDNVGDCCLRIGTVDTFGYV